MAAGGGASLARIDATTVRVIAESTTGIGSLHDDVASAVASDAELVVRGVIEQAKSFMRHSHRESLLARDILAALRVRGDPHRARGYVSRDMRQPLEFVPVKDAAGLYFVRDSNVTLTKLINAPLPPPSPLPQVLSHWLSFDGRAIQQNDILVDSPYLHDLPAVPSRYLMESSKTSSSSNVLKRPRTVTRQLDSYYQYVTSVLSSIPSKKSVSELDAMLKSLSQSPVIEPLLPALLSQYHYMVATNVTLSGSTARLIAANRALRAVVNNPRFGFEAGVHNVLPPLLTCVVGRCLGDGDHIALRHVAVEALRDIFVLYGTPLLRTRIVKTLVAVLTRRSSELCAVHGAILGLTALGPDVVRIALLPFVPVLARNLQHLAKLVTESQEQTVQKSNSRSSVQAVSTSLSAQSYLSRVYEEANNVTDALVCACDIHAGQKCFDNSILENVIT